MEQENKQENRFEETMIEGRNAVLEAFCRNRSAMCWRLARRTLLKISVP